MLPAQALYFGHPSRPLFGWYHPPVASGGRAVVLCNPLGLDATRAHWSYRHLAERLAAAGFDVLRFDWYGTGDSAGGGSEPDEVPGWLDDLGQAIEELKQRAGVARVHLIGLRAGATLAAQVAAARDDIETTVLWTPALTGGAWVAEMAKLHKLYLRIVPQIDPPEPGGEELLGSFASAATIAELGRIDLLGAHPPAGAAGAGRRGGDASRRGPPARASGRAGGRRHLVASAAAEVPPHGAAPGDAAGRLHGRHRRLAPRPA